MTRQWLKLQIIIFLLKHTLTLKFNIVLGTCNSHTGLILGGCDISELQVESFFFRDNGSVILMAYRVMVILVC